MKGLICICCKRAKQYLKWLDDQRWFNYPIASKIKIQGLAPCMSYITIVRSLMVTSSLAWIEFLYMSIGLFSLCTCIYILVWISTYVFSKIICISELLADNVNHANLTITNWRLLWSLHMKLPRILGGHSKKIEKSYKFSQKSETSSHQSNSSNYNRHRIYYFFL
jgi:hypothetical protein